jgi:glycosyltransferase involved in cell wall biosynthesis
VSTIGRRFLVVLPVRNGGEFLKICVKSILAQTNALFRLVVFDNASTDGTVAWLRNLNDSRIAIHESNSPLSIEDNWSRIRNLQSSDEYLTMIGHDDLLDPNFLSGISALIDRYPDARIYHSRFRLINAHGRTIRRSLPVPSVELGHEFLAARLAFKRDSFGTGYVLRMKDFIDVGGMPTYKGLLFADDALWMELMVGSQKVTLQEVSFSYRVHSGSTSYAPDWRSAFEALRSYTGFLVKLARADTGIRDAITQGIEGYLMFWLRWAYFSVGANQRNRDEFEREIRTLTDMVEPILGCGSVSLLARAKKALFGRFAWVRWMLWRSRKLSWSWVAR